jgi:hypothetical protein
MNLKDKIFKKIWDGKKTAHTPIDQSKIEPYSIYKKYIVDISDKRSGSSSLARKKISVWSECMELLPDDFIGLEFGVFEGRSINFFSKFCSNAVFYGFDTFDGLPEPWIDPSGRVIGKTGAFKTKFNKISFNENVKIVKGLFQDTLPKFLIEKQDLLEKVNLIHIDCDIYSSTRFVLDQCLSIIKYNKPYILFDEFVNCIEGQDENFKVNNKLIDITHGCESLAFLEFVEKNQIDFEVIVSFLKPKKNSIVLIKIL